ncbi:CHASE2 domain-containing protein [Chitinimonas sp.]|uniref:CHASE2 domain-containing protein n=1 Tax=Chitinimonas sp. TaxID=1934313 RepID=UPI0035AE80ED
MSTLRKHWLQLLIGCAVLLFALGYAGRYWRPAWLEHLDWRLYDARIQLTMPQGIDPRVVIVDIDERSLAEIGHWPWRRNILADLVRQLTGTYQAGVVGFDMVFPEADDSSGLPALQTLASGPLADDAPFQEAFRSLSPSLDYDARLADSLRGGRVVLGYYFSFAPGASQRGALPSPALRSFPPGAPGPLRASGYGANLPILQNAAGVAGHFNTDPDPDGVSRRQPLLIDFNGQHYEALSLAMVRRYLGQAPLQPQLGETAGYRALESLKAGPLRLAVDERARALVPYRGKQHSFRYLSSVDILRGKVDAAALKGRLVLIGTTAPGLLDLRVTPVDGAYPGVEVHANLIAAMLDGELPAQPGYLQGAETLCLLLAGGVLLLALLRLKPLAATLFTLALLAGVVLTNLALWQYAKLAMPLAAGVLTLLLLYANAMVCGYFFATRNKLQMTRLFGHYVPPELVAKMSEAPKKYSMEGQSRELTVLFSDVRGFTSIAERMEPRELAHFMNQFLTTLSAVIHDQFLGTIDKYIGDCIMAFWGAPVDDPEHPRHAVLAALQMHKAVAELNPRLQAQGWEPISIGIGINSGRMTVGDMGSQIRLAYTVMGDAVNLASRLESLTKFYGVGIIVGETTRQACGNAIVFRELDRIRVLGKSSAVRIYEPIGEADQLDAASQSHIEQFGRALALFRQQQWDQAEMQLINLHHSDPATLVYQVYLDRIREFRQNPPPAGWDGVHDFEHK